MLISSWFFLLLRRLNVIAPVLLVAFILMGSFPHYEPMTWIGCGLIATYGIVSLFFFRFGLVDAVWDHGRSLLVQDRWHRERIPLSAIKSLHVTEGTTPATATIRLHDASIFGYEVRFAVSASIHPINSHTLKRLKRLQHRLDQVDARAESLEDPVEPLERPG
ncbi:MAG: hypothetical protein KDI75_04320 [Xanthomonadales bacterium]|nr:hypothetical protein [Xanthomonadales bacterium]